MGCTYMCRYIHIYIYIALVDDAGSEKGSSNQPVVATRLASAPYARVQVPHPEREEAYPSEVCVRECWSACSVLRPAGSQLRERGDPRVLDDTSYRPAADYRLPDSSRPGEIVGDRGGAVPVLRDLRVKSAGKRFPGTPRVSMCSHEKEEEQLSVIGRSSP